MDTKSERSLSQGISIVCVFNDVDVRKECLDRSIDAYQGELDVDYRPIDNRDRQFSSAGAALNHGALEARHKIVVFVHQDVYLHSIDRLFENGLRLLDGTWSILGASGVSSSGEVVGRLRDRTDLIGVSACDPTDVDTLDEVLFMINRDRVVEDPLIEDEELAWHAYAVEYCVRQRVDGHRVGAVDSAITHNSLTINLDRLDVAHQTVGDRYPGLRPIHTTCGVIRGKRPLLRNLPILRNHRWRANWILNSVEARRLLRVGPSQIVLQDIRYNVDSLGFNTNEPLYIVNFDDTGALAKHCVEWLEFARLGKPVLFSAESSMIRVINRVRGLPLDGNVLVTGLDEHRLGLLCTELNDRVWVAGVQSGPPWAMAGPMAEQLPEEWLSPPARPARWVVRRRR